MAWARALKKMVRRILTASGSERFLMTLVLKIASRLAVVINSEAKTYCFLECGLQEWLEILSLLLE
jgi:hypothetical protein